MPSTAPSSVRVGADISRPRTDTFVEPVLVVDTREQLPYPFPGAVVKTLNAGDYSVLGYETRVAVERKTHADAYGSLGASRTRFQRELERLADYDYAAIVVECSLPDFLKPPLFSRLHPNAAIGSLLGWSVRYGLPVFFTSDREHGQSTTRQLLTKFAWYVERGEIGVR
jgi:ERCC4-type nuclease